MTHKTHTAKRGATASAGSSTAPLPAGKIDLKELDYPDTIFSQDIETRVFQAIVLQALSKIKDISLLEGSFIDALLRKAPSETLKGITVEPEEGSHSLNVKVEINIHYGVPIPKKAEEIHQRIVQELNRLTGLHIASVHVVFRNMILPDQESEGEETHALAHSLTARNLSDEETEEF